MVEAAEVVAVEVERVVPAEVVPVGLVPAEVVEEVVEEVAVEGVAVEGVAVEEDSGVEEGEWEMGGVVVGDAVLWSEAVALIEEVEAGDDSGLGVEMEWDWVVPFDGFVPTRDELLALIPWEGILLKDLAKKLLAAGGLNRHTVDPQIFLQWTDPFGCVEVRNGLTWFVRWDSLRLQ